MVERVRALPPLAFDVGVALACYGAAVAGALDHGKFGWWVVLFAAVGTLPLIWRRKAPILVTAVTGVGTTALALANATTQVPYGQLVATYTFASLCTGVWRLAGVVGTVGGVTASLVIPRENVAVAPVVAAAFAAAYALGTSARARRDRIALLEERTRRLAESHAAAAAEERERIARDVHDILAHSMSLVVVQAEAGPVVVRSDPDRAVAAFDNIATAGREALAQLRRTLGVLRSGEPSRAPQPELGELPALAERGRQAGLEVSLEERGQARPMPAEVQVAVYRMVQESLTNTIRHAGATRVRISLDWDADQLRLAVTDNGGGMPGSDGGVASAAGGGVAGHDGAGHGLIGMRERIAACGGQLSIGPGPDGTGFRVAATLPVMVGRA
jgi:signal transduction histidine kinase